MFTNPQTDIITNSPMTPNVIILIASFRKSSLLERTSLNIPHMKKISVSAMMNGISLFKKSENCRISRSRVSMASAVEG